MIKLSLFALPFTALFFVQNVDAQTLKQCQGPLISMEANGEIESLPDIAEVLLNVKSQNKTEGEALQELSKNLQKIIDVLDDLKIKNENIVKAQISAILLLSSTSVIVDLNSFQF